MKKFSLLLISTYGMGLQKWIEAGLYDREIGYYKKLGRYLKKFGIMTYDKTNEKSADEAYEYYYNKAGILSPFYSIFWPFLNLNTLKDYNVIKTNQFFGGWVALLIKFLFRRKIFIFRGGYTPQCEKMKAKLLPFLINLSNYFCMKFADLVFFVSVEDRDEYLYKYGKGNLAKCRILPNAVDTELFKPVNNISNEKIRISMVGRLVAMKNFHSVLIAISYLHEKLRNKLVVDIVGEGDCTSQLMDIAEKCGVNHRFWGALPNSQVASILGSSDIYLMPQLYGTGMSKGILEAMSAGNVVIASDIEAHKNTIDDKVDGFLCGQDAESIRKKLEHVITHLNSDEIKALRKRAIKKVRQNFSMNGISLKECEYVNEILN